MRAVLLATTAGAGAHVGDETVAERLVRQLRESGVDEVIAVTRPECRSALPPGLTMLSSGGVREDLRVLSEQSRAGRPLLIACADAVLADTAVSAVLSDPTTRSGVLVGPLDSARPLDVPVRRERGMVLSVSTGYHTVTEPNAVGSGLFKVSAPFLPEFRETLERLSGEGIANLAPGADAWTLAVLGMVRGGSKLNAYEVPGLSYGRVAGEAGARQLVADIGSADEDAIRQQLCVKRDDDLFATYAVSSYSRAVVRLCARLRLTPVIVTWLSILFAVVATGLFVQASRPALIGGAVAMYVSFLFDCVDGQLARYTHRFSAFGGWLDMIADRGKEYLIYAGLAVGAVASGVSWAWPVAIAAITVQVVRHMSDTWYGTTQDEITLRRAIRPLDEASDGLSLSVVPSTGGAGGFASRAGRKLRRLSATFTARRRSPAYWFKRTIVFPVGERWLVMGLVAAIFNGGVALAALLTWQLIALAYTLAGRTLQTWAAKTPVMARADVDGDRDDGPLVQRLLLPLALPAPLMGMAVLLVGLGVLLTALVPAMAVPAALLCGLITLALGVLTARSAHDGPLDWLVPAALRACEFGVIIAIGMAQHIPATLVFTLLGILALYHYDLAAKLDKAATPLTSRAAGLGWEGRTIVVLLALIPVIGVWVYGLLSLHLAIVFVAGALLGRRAHDAAEDNHSTPPRPQSVPA